MLKKIIIKGTKIGLSVAGLLLGAQLEASANDWKGRVLYFALLDRFQNGDQQNDSSHGVPECNNPDDIHAYQGGDLRGLQQRLPHIEDLGADALWVTPLYKGVPQKEGANCGFPGYWANFSIPYELELDPRFGTAAEFDSLIDAAHSRGMKVMLDMVVNHAGYEAAIVSQRPNWFHPEQGCGSWGPAEIFCPLAGLPDFAQSHPDAARFLTDIHLQWLRRFEIDGVRMDTVKHVEPQFFRKWIGSLKQEKPDLFMIGELLDEGSYHLYPPYFQSGFQGLFNFPLRRALINTFAKGQSVDHIAHRLKDTLAWAGEAGLATQVNLLDNHDVPRFLEEFPRTLSGTEVQRRYQLALGVLLTLPGIPQIYYGNEVGMYGGADPWNRRRMPQWAFQPAENVSSEPGFVERPGEVYAFVKKMIALRKQNVALRLGGYDEIWTQNGVQNANVYAFVRPSPEGNPGESVLVVVNNGEREPDEPLVVSLRGHFEEGATLVNLLAVGESPELVVREGSIPLFPEGKSLSLWRIQKGE